MKAALPDREEQILIERRKLWEQAKELRLLFSKMDLDAPQMQKLASNA